MRLFTKIFLSVFCFVVIVILTLSFFLIRNQVIYVEQESIRRQKTIGDFLSKQIEVGYLQSQLPYESLSELTKTDNFLFWWIVKDDGTIYRADKTSFMGTKALDYFPEAAKITSGESVFINKAGNYGVYLSDLNVSNANWKFWFGFSMKEMGEVQKNILVYSILIFVFSVTILGISLYFIVLFFLKPIKYLLEGVKEITKGNLNYVNKVSSDDEIGNLARSFNHMTEKLLKSRTNLEGKIRELSEEHGRMSSLVESVKLGVIMVDLSLNVILANSAAKKVLGRTETTNLIFRDLAEKIKGSVDISQALSYYVHTGTPFNIQEVMIGESYFRLFMSPVRDIIEQVFIGAVVVMEDITEQKKLDKMRTEIISITSHQLRTPSTIIKGNLEMVLGGEMGEISKDQRELLDDTYLGNQRMIRLINDLMDVAKIDEGKFKLVLEPAQLEDVVAEVVKLLAPLAKDKHVALAYEHPTAPFPPVKINRQRALQVVQNIIDNAVKYSSNGDKGKVTVEIQEDSKFLQLVIKDNGIGIPAGEQGKMFERFSRGSNTTKLDPGGGSGLGLYIAKAVVEQGGGRIWFESKENEGTTFHATFPYNE